jgi:hypothetical protein
VHWIWGGHHACQTNVYRNAEDGISVGPLRWHLLLVVYDLELSQAMDVSLQMEQIAHTVLWERVSKGVVPYLHAN